MSGTSGTTTPQSGTADVFGKTLFNIPTYRGSQSYNNGIGDRLHPTLFGFRKLLAVFPAFSASGTYYAWGQPGGPGQTTWTLRWFIAATGGEVSQGTNLSGEILQLVGLGL
jgi:hypothetical protein